MAGFNLANLADYVTTTESGCMEWNRARSAAGYGQIWSSGFVLYAHRVVCAEANGQPRPGDVAMHSCDNPPCVNPAHLRWGSVRDNVRDAVTKGRNYKGGGRRGEAHHSTPLTADLVRQIRAEREEGGETLLVLSQKYGVSIAAISKICRRETWTEVA